MGRASELGTAGVIAACGVSALIWWPDADAPWPVTVEIAEVPVAAASVQEPDAVIADDTDAGPDIRPIAFVPPDMRDASATRADFRPPGALAEGSGQGLASGANFAPGMRFPVETAQAFSNSQAWSPGGFYGPGDGQCAPENYAYPWRDTFCEDGGPAAPICPAGGNHTGQDLRPPTCQDGAHWAVAAADGVVTSVGAYSVRMMSEDGLRFTYLHLDPVSLTVRSGDTVARGQRLGRISNAYGGTPATIHLRFEIRTAFIAGDAGLITAAVPPYAALVDAYARLANGEERGEQS